MAYREDIPVPSKARRSEELISPDAEVALKVARYIATCPNGVTSVIGE
jgi:hypothetical protein